MKIADLKADVLRISDIYAREHSIDRDRAGNGDWALLKLQEELGEMTKEHLNLSGRARGKPDVEALADEAADAWGCCSSTVSVPGSTSRQRCSANG